MKKINSFRKLTFLVLLTVGTGWCISASAQSDQTDWEELNPFSKPRMALVSSAIGQNIFIFGGWTAPILPLADGEIYNTETGKSTPIANMSVGLAFPTADVIDNKIYICGGFLSDPGTTNLVQEYDPENDSWTLKEELPHGIGHHVSGVIDGKLYLAGGLHNAATDYSYGESISLVYDPELDQWDTIASMNSTQQINSRSSGRVQASSCVYNGKLYVFGGFRFNTTTHSYLPIPEVYDPVNDSWTDLAEMILPIAHHTSVVYMDKIYLFGGSTTSDYNIGTFTPSERVFEYDPALDSWHEMDTMPVGLVATEGHVIDNFLYLVGGDDDTLIGGEESGKIWKFNMDSLNVINAIEPHHESLQSLKNQPNPFKDHTVITYDVKEAGVVKLEVYDILGRIAITLAEEEQIPGRYTYNWNAHDYESGFYFCRLSLDGSSHAIKLVKQ